MNYTTLYYAVKEKYEMVNTRSDMSISSFTL